MLTWLVFRLYFSGELVRPIYVVVCYFTKALHSGQAKSVKKFYCAWLGKEVIYGTILGKSVVFSTENKIKSLIDKYVNKTPLLSLQLNVLHFYPDFLIFYANFYRVFDG